MLVLTRKPNESIQIGEDIEIKVIAVEGDQVKLGINAPSHVDIHRREVYLSIQEENNEAAGDDNLSILEALSQQLKK
ncbi:carbon storage regulator CsrA [Salibacterium halotolerans]|uniref:Translational regulator CsrA n=1 Tax=Salibacterium halotolerans TaxID=1884432 RepID=A0A1I5WYJ2_9BACI|nr:carbon storage regulator CsrA [Salibacterium halotolerans]SFQ24822.1 carbon storage regulator [Salibacterium halotolerans]